MVRLSICLLAFIFLAGCQCTKKSCTADDSCADEAGADSAGMVMVTEEIDVETDGDGGAFPLTTDRVYYGTDKYALTPEMKKVADSQIEWLNNNPGASIMIEGHCDERGTREYNLALGERRANGVKDYMVSHGIDASRVATISYGKDRPLVAGSTPEAWALNRVSVTVLQ